MALFPFASGDGWSFEIEYGTNFRATALYCHNSTPYTIWGKVKLANGQTFEREFAPAGTFVDNIERVNLPNNIITMETRDREGESVMWPEPITEVYTRVKY